MTRRLELLGLALAAIAALTAIAAASASAANFKFEKSPTYLKGEQSTENLFTWNGGTVKCKKAVFTSKEIIGTSVASATVSPAYSECTAFGAPVEVITTSCKFELTAAKASVGAVKIVCESGKQIVLKLITAGCTVSIPAQTPGTPTVEYRNEGSGLTRSVSITSKVEGITYASSGGFCGPSGTNGKYAGSILSKGFDTAAFTGQHGVWVE